MITVAAVKVLANGRIYRLPRPNRHGDILNMMKRKGELPEDYPTTTECGFIDDERGYVNRAMAGMIAYKNEQIKKKAVNSPDLYSEDLW